jgi:DNA repair photolyase
MSQLIYRPGGPALEYAALAANLYVGCGHACKYCYARDMAVNNGWLKSAGEFNTRPRPKDEDVSELMARFRRDVKKLAKAGNTRQVLLSFTTDAFQPLEEDLGITHEALLIMSIHGQKGCILTKAPDRALWQDHELIKRGGHSLGATITTMDQEMARVLEPGAPDPQQRMNALAQAHKEGISTWLSLEPIISPDCALQVLEAAMVWGKPHIALGLKSGSPYKHRHDWPAFRAQACQLLEGRGYQAVSMEQGWDKEPGTYLIKESLKKESQDAG